MNSLMAEDTQLRLTTADVPLERFAGLEAVGDYTAERLFRHRRADYDLIVRMLGEGMSVLSISRIMQCAEKTAAAVRDREIAHLPAPDVKVAMGQRWSQTFHIAQDIMQEIADNPTRRADVTFKDAAIAASIATQNHQLLAGDATARVEHVDGTSEHNALEEYLTQFRGRSLPATESPKVIEASTEDVVR